MLKVPVQQTHWLVTTTPGRRSWDWDVDPFTFTDGLDLVRRLCVCVSNNVPKSVRCSLLQRKNKSTTVSVFLLGFSWPAEAMGSCWSCLYRDPIRDNHLTKFKVNLELFECLCENWFGSLSWEFQSDFDLKILHSQLEFHSSNLSPLRKTKETCGFWPLISCDWSQCKIINSSPEWDSDCRFICRAQCFPSESWETNNTAAFHCCWLTKGRLLKHWDALHVDDDCSAGGKAGCPMTKSLVVQNPALSKSIIVPLGNTRNPQRTWVNVGWWLLGLPGTDWLPRFYQFAPGWLWLHM